MSLKGITVDTGTSCHLPDFGTLRSALVQGDDQLSRTPNAHGARVTYLSKSTPHLLRPFDTLQPSFTSRSSNYRASSTLVLAEQKHSMHFYTVRNNPSRGTRNVRRKP
ncbi:hypothetical protein KM043_005582 [Ampulex compressa]|nr:hypothetical protein KM043_005582 [Ampulex compressa]